MHEECHLKGIQGPEKSGVNHLPPFLFGETEETLEEEKVDLLRETKKKSNDNLFMTKWRRISHIEG